MIGDQDRKQFEPLLLGPNYRYDLKLTSYIGARNSRSCRESPVNNAILQSNFHSHNNNVMIIWHNFLAHSAIDEHTIDFK